MRSEGHAQMGRRLLGCGPAPGVSEDCRPPQALAGERQGRDPHQPLTSTQ